MSNHICLLCGQRDARNLQDNEHKELRDCVKYLRRKLDRFETKVAGELNELSDDLSFVEHGFR